MEEIIKKSVLAFLPGFCIGGLFGFIVLLHAIDEIYTEEKCFEFYDKHNYITNQCEIYKDKLEKK